MENTNQKNAVNEDLKDIQQMVDVVKRDGGVVEMYEEALLSPGYFLGRALRCK